MTLLENSSWFSHIQMLEKLDYGSTNSRLPSSEHGQDQDLPGASIPPAMAQQLEDVMGSGVISKDGGLAMMVVLWQPDQLLMWGDWLAPLQPAETRVQVAAPNQAGGSRTPLSLHCPGNSSGGNSPPSPFPSPTLGRAADKLIDSEGSAWKKTHSRQRTETHMVGNNISFVW